MTDRQEVECMPALEKPGSEMVEEEEEEEATLVILMEDDVSRQ